MSDLDRRISGDWIDVRESAVDFYGLNDHFKMTVPAMQAERRALALANEEGMTEYKRGRLSPVFTALEDMLYKALTQEVLEKQLASLHSLLFVTMLQRCVVLGTVQMVKGAEAVAADLDLDLKIVLSDVQDRVKADPALQRHAAVKNILLLIKRYQTEIGKMKELEPKIKPEARVTFLQNFKDTFAEIAQSIKKNYAELLKEQRAETPVAETSLARRVTLKTVAPAITQQAMTFARMRSTITFALAEKFGTREILGGLFHQKAQIMGLLDAELKGYADACRADLGDGSAGAAVGLSKSLRDELIQILERQERLEPS